MTAEDGTQYPSYVAQGHPQAAWTSPAGTVCAFDNDLPDSHLLIGAYDDRRLSGLKVDDDLLKKIAAIRFDGNILPLPVMTVDKIEFPEGDLLLAEVSPSLLPPVRYRGRVFVLIDPRRDIASEAEERLLTERHAAYMATFDATPCLASSLDDLELDYIKNTYLPSVVDADILSQDKRDIKDKLASIHLCMRPYTRLPYLCGDYFVRQKSSLLYVWKLCAVCTFSRHRERRRCS